MMYALPDNLLPSEDSLPKDRDRGPAIHPRSRSLIRATKVGLKRIIDPLRPYPFIMGVLPWAGWTARQLGSVIHPEAVVHGPLRLWEPAWFQMNRRSSCRNVAVPGRHFLYVGEDAVIEDQVVHGHTLVLGDRILVGEEVEPPCTTLSVDLEGNTAVCPGDSPRSRAVQRASAALGDSLHRLFREHGLRTVWYVVGKLFNDPCMRALCERLIDDPDVELGWHSWDHRNYFLATEDEIKRDMEHADQTREAFGIRLDALAFPFNAPGHIETVLANGFSSLRGYVGQYDLPFTVRFDGLSFFGSSLFLGPSKVNGCIRALEKAGGSLNIFMHPVDWIGHDLGPLREIMNRHSEMHSR